MNEHQDFLNQIQKFRNEQWDYMGAGRWYGPVSKRELKELITSGKLTERDEVRQANTLDWKEIRSVPELAQVVPGRWVRWYQRITKWIDRQKQRQRQEAARKIEQEKWAAAKAIQSACVHDWQMQYYEDHDRESSLVCSKCGLGRCLDGRGPAKGQ